MRAAGRRRRRRAGTRWRRPDPKSAPACSSTCRNDADLAMAWDLCTFQLMSFAKTNNGHQALLGNADTPVPWRADDSRRAVTIGPFLLRCGRRRSPPPLAVRRSPPPPFAVRRPYPTARPRVRTPAERAAGVAGLPPELLYAAACLGAPAAGADPAVSVRGVRTAAIQLVPPPSGLSRPLSLLTCRPRILPGGDNDRAAAAPEGPAWRTPAAQPCRARAGTPGRAGSRRGLAGRERPAHR